MKNTKITFEERNFDAFEMFTVKKLEDVVGNDSKKKEDTGLKYGLNTWIRKIEHPDGVVSIEIMAEQVFDSNVKIYTRPIVIEVGARKLVKNLQRLGDMGLRLNAVDINRIKEIIDTNWTSLPIKKGQVVLGFNGEYGNIHSFKAACTVGVDKKFYRNEATDDLPVFRGEFDKVTFEKVMKNKKRRLVVLHGLVAPLIGLFVLRGDNVNNPVILIFGDSSTGKSTLALYVISLSANLGYSNVVMSFNSTVLALLEKAKSNMGVPVLIDDTSSGTNINYEELIYGLAEKYGRIRLTSNKGQVNVVKNELHGTSYIMTGESNIMDEISSEKKGVYGRMFPMEVDKDLFDKKLIDEVNASMEQNSGTLLPLIVQWIFEKGIEEVLNSVEAKRNEVLSSMENKVTDETRGILNRWSTYFGCLHVVGQAIEDVTGIKVDVTEVIDFMTEEITTGLHSFNEDSLKVLVAKELYPALRNRVLDADCEIVKDGRFVKDGKLYIRPDKLKEEIRHFMSNNGIKNTNIKVIRRLLEKGNYIEIIDGQACRNLGVKYGGRNYCLGDAV